MLELKKLLQAMSINQFVAFEDGRGDEYGHIWIRHTTSESFFTVEHTDDFQIEPQWTVETGGLENTIAFIDYLNVGARKYAD